MGVIRKLQAVGAARGYIFLCSVLLYLLSVIFPFPGAQVLLAVSSVCCLLAAFAYCSLVSKALSVAFVVCGLYFAHTSSTSWFHILTSFGSMSSLLCLFAVVPLIAIPVRVGHYEVSVSQVLQKRHLSDRKLYFTISAFAYLLGSLMNIATIPMMYHAVRGVVERSNLRDGKRFLVQSIVTGYAMPLAWSPVTAVVAAVVNVTRVAWLAVLPLTLIISFAGLALSVLLFKGSRGPAFQPESADVYIAAAAESSEETNAPTRGHSIWQIPIAIVAFIACMLLIQHWSGWSMLEVISILSIPFAAAWSALMGEGLSFVRQLARHHATVRNLHGTFAVFTAAGFFVSTLEHAQASASLNRTFVHVAAAIGPSVFIAVIPIIVIAMSMIGFHPVVSIALLGTSLHPSVLHMSPIWLSIALFGGGVLTFIVSPFNATLNVTGTVAQQSPWTIMRWNVKFCICFLVLIVAIVAIGQRLLPHWTL
ncbi:hypothetical protein JI721_04830 [Alicyclobacillus cycloheptanicus]|uniref:Di-and tricarboxylate transporter n=1 Tax=Alicyclobacillus cycloheptanicus TaxID=1457 RepID=A0ABT9XI21_9BACL|nr:hypothetical protein [Alicyclobacillus cycloheptanicus]MDQ0189957.1 hypothetical protein [Alicyclobacillus cycloheptanicus]WDM02147.1 hypothetical protein JI721_04830 [Alicyclobacillus cycloheptanicus]